MMKKTENQLHVFFQKVKTRIRTSIKRICHLSPEHAVAMKIITDVWNSPELKSSYMKHMSTVSTSGVRWILNFLLDSCMNIRHIIHVFCQNPERIFLQLCSWWHFNINTFISFSIKLKYTNCNRRPVSQLYTAKTEHCLKFYQVFLDNWTT